MSTPHVLVVNAGSSSLKYSLVDATTGESPGSGLVERIGESSSTVVHQGPEGESRIDGAVADHEEAFRLALHAFEEHGPSLSDFDVVAVGHRAVHGGELFSAPVLVTDEVTDAIRDLIPLAPLHNPANLEGIAGARTLFPDLPHVAVFDTAFHQTLEPHAWSYAVPRSWATEHGIRRYGFHGTSFSFVSRASAELLGTPLEETNLIVAHLGNGASVAAIHGGRSVETSMGLTPLEGLVMGTRSGDVDPALHAHLHRELGWSLDEIDRELNRESGLKGLAGENDFREVLRLREEGDEGAGLAFDVYVHRLRKYVGAYYAVLGRVDAIVFTGGVGENAALVRSAALSGLEPLGIQVDAELNDVRSETARLVSSERSRVAVAVVPTDEEWEIARQAVDLIG
ncbi:acetate kinase [Nocardioides daedukensis]|uniref:Acetate kinase n=1 Tax=Nocardioides daedukensis TaxID=634462 RepID=A0A7Y9UQG5_9ACTN|nr:acetate kinase [Nocardioides daedukensis]NYG58586.1 acetate kinase [Nocardioides daedukensis]